MKKTLLLSAAALLTGFSAMAVLKDSYVELEYNAYVSGMSTDGNLVAGYSNDWNYQYLKSFVYNNTTGEMKWITDYDSNAENPDLDKTGQFRDVSNNGIICGTMLDKDNKLTIDAGGFAPGLKNAPARAEGEVYYVPLNVAAVWKDGVPTKLGYGPCTLEDFASSGDGSYATFISDDGKTVLGYIQQSWVKTKTVKWVYNEATGQYDYTVIPLPEGTSFMEGYNMSADGSIVVGYAVVPDPADEYNNTWTPYIWDAEGNATKIDVGIENMTQGKVDAISPNGKYLLISAYSQTEVVLGVYDLTTNELTKAPVTSDFISPCGYTISNNADVTCSFSSSTDYKNSLYYFSPKTGTFIKFDDYLKNLELDIADLPSFQGDWSFSQPYATSADFSRLCGRNCNDAGDWILSMSKNEAIMLNTPQSLDLYFSAMDKLTFTWKGLDVVPEGVTITEYVATIGDEEVALTPDKAVDGVFTATVDAEVGQTYTASVYAKATLGDKALESPLSAQLSAFVSAETAWKLFDNMDNVSADTQGNLHGVNDWWTSSLPKGSSAEIIKWNLESSNYENNTPYYSTTCIATQPWSSTITSRFLDATEADNFYLSFYMGYQLVNTSTRQDLDTDYLDVEYSTNGKDWKVLKSYRASDLVPYAWNFYKFDLTPELAGKVYRLRFNAHGEGKGNLKWNIDVLNINDELKAPAPTGLTAVVDEENGGVDLQWHNTIGAYELSYVINSNILTDYCTGSEGTPMISAVEFDPSLTDSYAGNYISSVSCFLYDNPNIPTNTPTKAEAIVYANGVEVARTAYTGTFDTPYASTIALEKPVLIEAGKTYKVGIRIFDYDAAQTPVYYQSTEDYIAGKTDLYSEDEGKTWERLSDFYTGEQAQLGQCIWPIRANITASADKVTNVKLDQEILAYNLFCNDEQLNDTPIYATYPHFTDKDGVLGAKYAVQAFYRDGRISPLCEATTAVSSVADIAADDVNLTVEPGLISVNGAFDSIEVFAIDGTRVARTNNAVLSTANLADGIYVVRVKTASRVIARKIAIRK